MAIKKYIIEIAEGHTPCDDCPIHPRKGECGADLFFLQCKYYDLTTLKIKEIEHE